MSYNEMQLTTIEVSKGFVDWLRSWKLHKKQSNREQCDEIMEICKSNKILEKIRGD